MPEKIRRSRFMTLIIAQFTQGVTPQKIALTLALGISLGIFPIIGATTVLCTIAGVWLKCNQPIIQSVNWIVSPLQLALILVFARIGEWLMRAQHVSVSVPVLFRKFHESPAKFFQDFGLTGLHAIVAWLLIAPFLIAAIYFLLLTPLKKLSQLSHH